MSVILEFTVDNEAFEFGRVLAVSPEMHIELERVVPTGDTLMPFLWVSGGNTTGFEESVRDHPAVRELRAFDRIGDSTLYRIEWEQQPKDLIAGIADADATVLEAEGNGTWVFHLRFHDHEKLSQFHNYVIEEGVPIHIERTYTLTDAAEYGHRFDLTAAQREALILALREGYFQSPREGNLDDIAEELGITPQALSKRIRRGNETVLRKVLLSSAADFE